jgi:(p)ppGpp synthase/HD superfamily hydrolase
METLIEKAKQFAKEAHKNHTENDALKTPYYFHLQRVASLVQLSGGSEEEIASAWLHDTVEDTGVTIEDIEREFGKNIATIVNGLTDLPEWSSLPVGERKRKQAEKISKENESVRRVKIADQISGGELDARNTLMSKEERLERFEGVKKVANACRGVSKELDHLFASVSEEMAWLLANS